MLIRSDIGGQDTWSFELDPYFIESSSLPWTAWKLFGRRSDLVAHMHEEWWLKVA